MFDTLSDKLQGVFAGLRGRGKLSAADIDKAMRAIRMSLLEADVSLPVVKQLTDAIKARSTGAEVMQSLTPDQQVVKIVNEELAALMGGTAARMPIASKPPTVILMAGLQGSGKTTFCAKLAFQMRKEGRAPLLVACDLQRPAAMDQLQVLGTQIDVPVWREDSKDPVKVAENGVREAKRTARDVVIVDTAGRLTIDEDMMGQLIAVKGAIDPTAVVLVLDAMTGQTAVDVASAFQKAVQFDGVVLTKLDGDARGGAALSVRAVTGKPILFVGTGEKVDALEQFHPDRMAQRILGMGDVLSLIERASETVDKESVEGLGKRLRSGGAFTLDDMLEQMKQIRKMGPLSGILGMIPGLSQMKKLKDADIDERQMDRVEAIILSMTSQERRKPDVLNGSRRKRIAQGSGTSVQEVNQLLNQFKQMQKLMKSFGKGGKLPPGFGNLN
ncbi:MAG TPA: signal recognition particle protein [Miltoncostaeales bacterium]|nr:signal recognition particle protein [Miltoncostaeales bacterium]